MLPDQTKLKPQPESAFSRLDLIVVLAVVAVLLTVLLSAQGAPRNRVYQTTDVNNYRRTLQATFSYAADHNDTLPNCGWGTFQASWAYAPNLPNAGYPIWNYPAAYRSQLAYLTNGQLYSYIQDARVFLCPADRPDNVLFAARNIYITSYVWNGAVNGYSTASAYKLAQFRPDAVLQWEANDATPFFLNDASSYPDEGISLRHGTNLLFGLFGGGVGTATAPEFNGNSFAGIPGQRGAGIPPSFLPNRMWCNPGVANGRY
jgi:type II secretory pathway pseudopilin PulG